MRILLDTHVLLWALNDPSRLDVATADLLTDPANQVCFSAASIWEIAIKSALVKPGFGYQSGDILRAAVTTGFTELPVASTDAIAVEDLPQFSDHKDPFDRLLIAQSIVGSYRLLTADPQLQRYSPLVTLLTLRSPA